MSDLFGGESSKENEEKQYSAVSSSDRSADFRPLAERLRPQTLEEYLGQEELVGPDGPLRKLIASDRIPSMMLWGPPGSGKTTLARLIANKAEADFVTLSAVTAALRDVRSVIDIAKTNLKFHRKTILFIDEIHRFNKAQQDAFLPHVESGILTLIGATTENPSFSIISPLLSRSRVFVLKPMTEQHLLDLLQRGVERLNTESGEENGPLTLPEQTARAIASLCDGDARRAIGMLEIAASLARTRGSAEIGEEDAAALAQRHLIYDRTGEEHYNLISALHKTIRSSDPHGAIYWLTRMLAAGEDPLYVARRLVRMASEDIGLADPGALPQAMEAMRAYQLLGSPEGELALVQAASYLALAPKSNSIYRAYKDAMAEINASGSLPVPMHLRNAPTGLMKNLGYSEGYSYDHDSEASFIAKQGLPDRLHGRRIFQPSPNGWEGQRKERLEKQDRERDQIKPESPD